MGVPFCPLFDSGIWHCRRGAHVFLKGLRCRAKLECPLLEATCRVGSQTQGPAGFSSAMLPTAGSCGPSLPASLSLLRSGKVTELTVFYVPRPFVHPDFTVDEMESYRDKGNVTWSWALSLSFLLIPQPSVASLHLTHL